MSIVSNNIKYLRRLSGLTQEQFARKIGIKRSLVGAYEEARANPNLDNLKNMAFVFGVTVDNLVKSDIRKLREGSDTALPFSTPVQSQREEVREPEDSEKPFAAIMGRFNQPASAERAFTSPPSVDSEVFAPSAASVRSSSENGLAEVLSKPAKGEYSHRESVQQRSGSMKLVRNQEIANYLHHYQQERYLETLPELQLPGLPAGYYRAFEAGRDFVSPGAVLVGALLTDLFEIEDNKQYILILKSRGLVFRRVFNQLRIKGVLLLSSDLHQTLPIEVPSRDVVEVWEVRAVISYQLPEPSLNFGRMQQLVDALQQELNERG